MKELFVSGLSLDDHSILLHESNAANCNSNLTMFVSHFYLSVDATNSKRIGRLVNHSRTQFNLRTKLFEFDNKPHLGLVASRVR